MSEEIQFWNPRQTSLGREGYCHEVTLRDIGAPPKSPRVLRLLSAILPSKWLAIAEYLLCAKYCAWAFACSFSVPLPPYLSWKPGGVASLRKIGLAKWGEIQIPPGMWPWHGDIPTVQKLVNSLQLQKYSSVNGTFIHSVSVCWVPLWKATCLSSEDLLEHNGGVSLLVGNLQDKKKKKGNCRP